MAEKLCGEVGFCRSLRHNCKTCLGDWPTTSPRRSRPRTASPSMDRAIPHNKCRSRQFIVPASNRKPVSVAWISIRQVCKQRVSRAVSFVGYMWSMTSMASAITAVEKHTKSGKDLTLSAFLCRVCVRCTGCLSFVIPHTGKHGVQGAGSTRFGLLLPGQEVDLHFHYAHHHSHGNSHGNLCDLCFSHCSVDHHLLNPDCSHRKPDGICTNRR